MWQRRRKIKISIEQSKGHIISTCDHFRECLDLKVKCAFLLKQQRKTECTYTAVITFTKTIQPGSNVNITTSTSKTNTTYMELLIHLNMILHNYRQ